MMTQDTTAHAQQLFNLASQGDVQAIEKLLKHCQPDLRRYARRHCASDDVDDAVQDALWILSKNLGALRAAAALSSWLFQVVRRACLRISLKRRDTVTLDDAEAELASDSQAVHNLRIDLARIFATLPSKYREALMLIDVLGHSAEEAAQELGVSVEAAKSRLHRGRLLVREALAPRLT